MVSFLPAMVVFLPLALVASLKRRWAIMFLLASIPLFDVTVFTAISHQFTVPEIGIFTILASLLINLQQNSTFSLGDKLPLISGAAFVLISTTSIILLVVQSPSILVNPYGRSPDRFTLELVTISFSNVTQLSLRLFFMISVFTLGITIDADELNHSTRVVILGAIFAGAIGLIYQIFALLQSDLLIRFLHWFGDTGRLSGMGMVGPLPRMGSVTGEPGHTAQYLLYAFAVSATLLATGSYNVFSKRSLHIVTAALGGMLLMSTSGTAYGGLIIFTGVILGSTFIHQDLNIVQLMRSTTHFIIPLVSITVIFILFNAGSVADIAMQQYHKLTFQSGSGTIRARYFRLTMDVVRERPFFGLGTGSYYSTSLIGTILGETGIFGLATFLGFCIGCIRPAVSRAFQYCSNHHLEFALAMGAITLVLTSLVAKSITTLLSPWFWVALGLPVSLAFGREQRTKHI